MSSREAFIAELEALGEDVVRAMQLTSGWTPPFDAIAAEWLAFKANARADAASARAEARAEEALSISRKALAASRWATIIAMMAMIIAAKEIIEEVVMWMLRVLNG
jgi:hypothetical protein